MAKKKKNNARGKSAGSKARPDRQAPSNEFLSGKYFGLDARQKQERFADTARSAEIIGLTQRTVQRWARKKEVSAIQVGKKYMVLLDSLCERHTREIVS